jgi:putative restriction endonuclease
LTTLEALPQNIDAKHRAALSWFQSAEGKEVGWAEITEGTGFPITTQKGIYKPAGNPFVLSIRQAEGSAYGNMPIETSADGAWSLEYFQEGHDPATVEKHFTNRALFACRDAGVPLGVIVQTRRKPATYRIHGLAVVTGFANGYFRLQQFARGSTATIEAAAQIEPVGLDDARKRINVAIALRQGSGAFRTQALAGFDGRCAISNSDAHEALEAAHIVPYLGAHTNILKNTLLLRADLHTLFDRQLLDIDPASLRVRLAAPLKTSTYGVLDGAQVRLPHGVSAAEIGEMLLLRLQHLNEKANSRGKLDL